MSGALGSLLGGRGRLRAAPHTPGTEVLCGPRSPGLLTLLYGAQLGRRHQSVFPPMYRAH